MASGDYNVAIGYQAGVAITKGQQTMKKIILTIDDDVYKALKNYINVKGITGNFGGIADAFISKLIIKIEDNKKEWHCSYKKKEDNK